ncbi:hypothetical protein LCGC14_2736940 [marine sediment metagenome]|uniref:Uncharacterized protein n=1 Tax=marine sediment metagenome TaxID=412755 RepID=A0A0F8ZSV0_9ZZZZ
MMTVLLFMIKKQKRSKMTNLETLAKEHGLEEICLACELYNPTGCVNSKGRILCSTRDYLQGKVRNLIKENIPYNWRIELR